MMFRLAIVEDEKETMEAMCQYIRQYDEKNGTRHQVSCFYDGDEILDEYESVYDAILLDIQMKRVDGLKTAQKIRKTDENVVLIFVTNMVNYAIRGYEVNAYDFVLKPATYFAISRILEKVDKLLKRRSHNMITFSTIEGTMRFRTNEIYYFESFDHKVQIHTSRGDFWGRQLMRDIEKEMQRHGFYRCSNSYLINMAFVECFHKNNVQIAGKDIPISRAKKKEFMEIFTDYMGRKAYE